MDGGHPSLLVVVSVIEKIGSVLPDVIGAALAIQAAFYNWHAWVAADFLDAALQRRWQRP